MGLCAGSGCVYQWGTGLLNQAKRALNPQPVPAHFSAKEPCLVTGKLYGGLLVILHEVLILTLIESLFVCLQGWVRYLLRV